jgi:hypothetical protein
VRAPILERFGAVVTLKKVTGLSYFCTVQALISSEELGPAAVG